MKLFFSFSRILIMYVGFVYCMTCFFSPTHLLFAHDRFQVSYRKVAKTLLC